MKTSGSIKRKQKPGNVGGQVPAIDTCKGIDFSQASCTAYMDQSADVALEEVNSYVLDILHDGNCEFLDLEEVTSHAAEDTVHLEASNHSDQTEVENKAIDQQLADTAAAAAAVSSPVDDAVDEIEGATEMDICLLHSPDFNIYCKSGCTTPASLTSLNLDVSDTTLSEYHDLLQDDEHVLPGDAELPVQSKQKDLPDECHDIDVVESPERRIQSALPGNEMKLWQSEKTQDIKEPDEEYASTHSISGSDPVGSDGILQLEDERMDPVDSAAEPASASPESLTSGWPHQPLCTQWSLDIAVEQTEVPAAEGNLFPDTQSSEQQENVTEPSVEADKQLEPKPTRKSLRTRGQLKKQTEKSDLDEKSVYYAECIQLATVENDTEGNDTEGNQCEESVVIPSQLALNGKKEKSLLQKRTLKEQPKTVADERLLKNASIADESLLDDSACSDFAVTRSKKNRCQNSTRKRSRQVKANSPVTGLEVETYSEPRLPRADAEALHGDIGKESLPKPSRSLKPRGQNNKQMWNTEKSVSQKSKQNSYMNLMSSQHEFVTCRTATKTNNANKKPLKKLPTGRKSRTLKQQKKLTENSVNQKTKVDSPKPDEYISLSSFQASGAHAHESVPKTSLVADSQLEPKPTQSLRTRGQLKKQTGKSVDAENQRKPDSSSAQQDMCPGMLSLQQSDETRDITSLQTTVINSEPFNFTENGNRGQIFQENDTSVGGQLPEENRSTGSRPCSISGDSSSASRMPRVRNENDAASPAIQPTASESAEDIGCCQKNSPALSGRSEELVGGSPAESCILRQAPSSQSQAAAQADAVDNSQCSAVVNDQEQSADAALMNVASYSVQDTVADSMEIAEGMSHPHGVHFEAVVSQPVKRKSSVPQCFGLSCGRAVISRPSSVDYGVETLEADAAEAMHRMVRVTASLDAYELNNEDGERDEDDDSLNSCPSDINTNITHHQVASQNSLVLASQDFAPILPPVDNLHHTPSCSGNGSVYRASSGSTRVQRTGHTVSALTERTYEGEDPVVAGDGRSQPAASQRIRRRKCSVAVSQLDECFLSYGFARNAGGVHERPVVRDVPPAVDNTGPEVSEIPSTLPSVRSQARCSNEQVECTGGEGRVIGHGARSPAETTASQQPCRRMKCSAIAYDYSSARQAVQQQASASTARDTSEIAGGSLSQVHRHSQTQSSVELQQQASRAGENDSLMDFTELSQEAAVSQQQPQQHRRHKCSVVADECGLRSQRSRAVATAGADHNTTPEVCAIPSSLPPTRPQRYSSSVAPIEAQPVASFSSQAVDNTRRAGVAARRQSSLPDDDAGGNMSSFVFPCRGLHNTDVQQSGRVADASDGCASVNASQAGVEPRVKVSEPLVADCRSGIENESPAE